MPGRSGCSGGPTVSRRSAETFNQANATNKHSQPPAVTSSYSRGTTMQKILKNLKWILLILIVLLVILVIFQNLEQIDVELLFFTRKLRLAELLVITLLIGFLLGLAAGAWWRVRHWRHARDKPKPSATDQEG